MRDPEKTQSLTVQFASCGGMAVAVLALARSVPATALSTLCSGTDMGPFEYAALSGMTAGLVLSRLARAGRWSGSLLVGQLGALAAMLLVPHRPPAALLFGSWFGAALALIILMLPAMVAGHQAGALLWALAARIAGERPPPRPTQGLAGKS